VNVLPAGFGVAVDADTKQVDANTLFGGSPARLLRLTPAGADAWRELQGGPVGSVAAGALARRLTDAGLAHPRPPAASAADATVVIPVRDRTALLDRCLAALGDAHRVVVVDDGSTDPSAVAAVACRHGAAVFPRRTTGGPAAARNTGLGHVAGELVAFLDSDCVPPPHWLDRLAGHFADPLVGAVAPRIVADDLPTSAGRYGARFGSLDLGAREARVVPSTRVGYVPTAALIVRRAALADIARGDGVFDADLRYGEDVDLIWRLHEAGWRIRYDPSVQVTHREPATWQALLARRFRYGTSAAPLARRHPRSIAPLVVQPWPAATVAALLARRPVLACVAFGGSVLARNRALRTAGVPAAAVAEAAVAVGRTWLGVGRYLCQFAAPALLGAAAIGGRRRWGRRAALASLLAAPACARGGTARFALARVADDFAYGAGVWAGCARERTFRPLVPSWRRPRSTSPERSSR
jgi:mycofactocin system glycosyltransferase